MFLLFFLLIAAASGQQCGQSRYAPVPSNNRIVHGEEARKGAWPWIVPLFENGRQMCGGSIINDRWIVTAAHCFPNLPQVAYRPPWSLETGDHVIYTKWDDPNSQEHYVELIVKHEQYRGQDPTDGNDIALIKVQGNIRFTDFVQPICLPVRGESRFNEYEPTCYAAGWGESFGTSRDKYTLQQVHSQIVNYNTCQNAHSGYIKQNTICFGDGRKGACMGDSGGPLMCKRGGGWKLAGITSWGNSRCNSQPGVFTEAGAFIDWIQRTISRY